MRPLQCLMREAIRIAHFIAKANGRKNLATIEGCTNGVLLWMKERLPEAWKKAAHFFDLPDFLTYRATGDTGRSLVRLFANGPISVTKGKKGISPAGAIPTGNRSDSAILQRKNTRGLERQFVRWVRLADQAYRELMG